MAERYNLSSSIIDGARKILSERGHDRGISALDNLQKIIADNENRERLLKDEIAKNEQAKKRLIEREEKLDDERSRLLEDVELNKRTIIEQANQQIEAIFKELQKPDVKMHEVIAAKRKLKEIAEEDIEVTESSKEKVNVDDYVAIKELGIIGRVERLANDKVFIVSPDGFKFSAKLDQVAIIEKPAQVRLDKPLDLPRLTSDVKLELNVIGLHVDEALYEVEKYLDGARLKRFSQVRIIHGFGTGALKRAIHDYLNKCDFVGSFRPGDQHEGSGGATVVKFK